MRAITVLLPLGLSFLTVCHANGYVLSSTPEDAMAACKEKAAASPEKLREQMLDFCNCVVKKTDFEQAAKLNKLGKTEELQQLYKKAESACY